MDYKVRIEAFEGPLDLLLNLIDKNEIDIYDIPIHAVTDQFINYIQMMNEVDIEMASEFIVMASILLEIKSKLLLPKEKIIQDGLEVEIDPRIDLVKKLEEYKLYKELSLTLKSMQEDHLKSFYKMQEDFSEYTNPIDELKEIDLDKLSITFKNIIKRIEDQKTAEDSVKLIRHPEIKQEICENNIIRVLSNKKAVTFSELITIQTKSYAIAYFLAILELLKKKFIVAYQNNNCEDIIIERTDRSG
ncbi:MAG TPA: segregation/condensation protein A [Soehngenia sp.]|nr:segregation/condensation protein A [Soehngenia sp.]